MANFQIRGADPTWVVRLANTTSEHAQSVLAQLEQDSSVPSGLHMKEVENLYDDKAKARKRRLFFFRKEG